MISGGRSRETINAESYERTRIQWQNRLLLRFQWRPTRFSTAGARKTLTPPKSRSRRELDPPIRTQRISFPFLQRGTVRVQTNIPTASGNDLFHERGAIVGEYAPEPRLAREAIDFSLRAMRIRERHILSIHLSLSVLAKISYVARLVHVEGSVVSGARDMKIVVRSTSGIEDRMTTRIPSCPSYYDDLAVPPRIRLSAAVEQVLYLVRHRQPRLLSSGEARRATSMTAIR